MTINKTANPTKGTTRRRILQIGGAAVLLTGGAVTWRGIDRGAFTTASGPAYAPWDLLDDPQTAGTPLALVAAGVLAANAHNTQPWLFEVSERQIALYADLSRHLGSFDPFLREMHLSLGCALENMMAAAPAHGFTAQGILEGGALEAITDRQGRQLVARIRLQPSGTDASALGGPMARRHTNRGPFERDRPVPDEVRQRLSALASPDAPAQIHWISEGAKRDQLDALTIAATERIIADYQMALDSDRWFRLTRQEIDEHRDGPTIDAAGLPAPVRMIAKLLPRLSADEAHAVWLETTRDVHLATAPLLGLITVRTLYDTAETLDAGRLWQRLHLAGVADGLALHPINQTVEVVDRERDLNAPARMAEDLADLLGTRERRPTFVFRVGYPARDAFPSPRRALDDVLVQS